MTPEARALALAVAKLRPAPTMTFPDDATTIDDIEWNDPRPKPTQEEIASIILFDRVAALARLKATRTPILDALAGIAGRLDRKGLTAESLAADAAAQALLDLPAHAALAAAADDKVFDKTALLLYRQIAAACPPVVQAAFIGAM